ncbi:MAG: biopolymer transporter ExbD [Steroidobacteraceae bacterium]
MSIYSRYMRSEAELNLIPLIDIMSVMVAFLLIYTADVEVVQNTKSIEIPYSSAETKPKQAVTVMVTKEHVFVQGELVASLADIRSATTDVIEPLRQVLERPMLADNGPAEPSEREIIVIADKTLPFELVEKVMATCSASEYGTLSLAVIQKETPANAAS